MAMLQAHSILWHYLWVAPDSLLLVLAIVLWKRGIARQFPAFLAFAFFSSITSLILYVADVLPFVSAPVFWSIDWAYLIGEAILKFAVIAEFLAEILHDYAVLSRIARILVSSVGVVLVFAASLAAAIAPKSESYGIINGTNLLDQTTYLVESGVLVVIFLFCGYFHLSMGRKVFGIAFGLSFSACVHLATWALIANNGIPVTKRPPLVFLNMAIYHVSVLVWGYCLLAPEKKRVPAKVLIPENTLAVWNRELERLLQK